MLTVVGIMKKTYQKKLFPHSNKTAIKVVLIYLLLAVIWNFASEYTGYYYFDHVENHHYIEILINLIFFTSTAIVLFLLIKQSIRNYREVNQKLETQIDLYNLIASNTNDVIWLLNLLEGKFKFVSPAVQKLRGFTPEEVIAKPFEESFTKESYDLIGKNLSVIVNDYERGNESARTQTVEVDQPRKDGSIVNTEVVVTLLKNKDGKVTEVLGISRDITGRIKTKNSIVESEEQYRRLVEFSPDAVFVHTDGRFVFSNHAGAKLLGAREPQEIYGKQIMDFVQHKYQPLVAQRIGTLQKGSRVPLIEEKFVRLDGKTVDVEVSASPLTFYDKPSIQVIARDISERKTTEKEIALLNERLSHAANLAFMGVWDWDLQKNITTWDDKMFEIYGLSKIVPMPNDVWMRTIHPDDSQIVERSLRKTISSGIPDYVEFRIVRPVDGATRFISAAHGIARDENGIVSRLIGSNIDITEHKKAEEFLLHNERKYHNIIETALNGFFILDVKGKIHEVNDAFCQMSGYKREELLKMEIQDLDFLETPRSIREHGEQIIKFGPQKFETKFPARNGSVISAEVSLAYSPDDGGIFYGFVNNLTEKNKMLMEVLKARDEAERSTQLKSEFLAQMSHEIRSPLNVTLSFTNYMKEELKSKLSPELEESFFAIDTSIKRVIRTIDLILNMSEMQVGTYEPTWRNFDLFEEVFKGIQREYDFSAKQKGLDLTFTNNVKSAKVYGDQYSVVQIFANLIDNAIKYTNIGQIDVTIDKDKQRNLTVKVKDTGIGISKEYLSKLFLPFTQEEQGYSRRFEGNGLGLALVKRYCDLNNATISVESYKGMGTTFIVTFRRLSKLNVEVN